MLTTQVLFHVRSFKSKAQGLSFADISHCHLETDANFFLLTCGLQKTCGLATSTNCTNNCQINVQLMSLWTSWQFIMGDTDKCCVYTAHVIMFFCCCKTAIWEIYTPQRLLDISKVYRAELTNIPICYCLLSQQNKKQANNSPQKTKMYLSVSNEADSEEESSGAGDVVATVRWWQTCQMLIQFLRCIAKSDFYRSANLSILSHFVQNCFVWFTTQSRGYICMALDHYAYSFETLSEQRVIQLILFRNKLRLSVFAAGIAFFTLA